jgi:hypothetical protein
MKRQAKLRALVFFSAAAAVCTLPWSVTAQTVGETFRKVSPAVVVIRATGRAVSDSGEVRFSEIGPGVTVMTAAHVVHGMDEIRIEFSRRSSST